MAITLRIIAWQAVAADWVAAIFQLRLLCQLSTRRKINRCSFTATPLAVRPESLGATLLSGRRSMDGSTIYPQTRYTAESLSLVVQRSDESRNHCQFLPCTQRSPNRHTQATSLSSTPLRPTLSRRRRHATTGTTTMLCELLVPSCDTCSVEVSLALEQDKLWVKRELAVWYLRREH
ncbi:hypothetical protein BGW80DRAFT_590550 [Lactifluus volemus]|nr:hypothetical protein BGW80DRAFT_590550 [Lactifluus volemus]